MGASSSTLEKSLLKSASTLVDQWITKKGLPPAARCRKIEGLAWAKCRSDSPWGKGPKPSGSIAKGLTYERKFGRHLYRAACQTLACPEVVSAQWIEFEDENGAGNAQPDHVLIAEETLWIFENKLTYTKEGWHQLDDLYKPLCEQIWGLPPILVLVCKNLGEGGLGLVRAESQGGTVTELESVLKARALEGGSPPRFFIHWLGINNA